MGFETVRLNGLPIWLDGPNGRAYQGALGGMEDESLDLEKQGAKSRFAKVGCVATTDDAGLDALGETRRILRAPTESGGTCLGRLSRAPLHWYWAGTDAGLLLPFEPFYGPLFAFDPPTETQVRLDPVRDAQLIALQKARGRVSPDIWLKSTPPVCTAVQVLSNGEVDGYWDGNEDWFTRVFWIAYSGDGEPWDTDAAWDDDGDWDDGGLWDTTMTAAEATYLRAQIRRNKSPGSYPTTIAVALPGNPEEGFWGSPGTWDDGGVWGEEPTSDPLYITVGHVWGEEAWLGAVGEYPLTDIWPSEDDGLGGYNAYEEDPVQR